MQFHPPILPGWRVSQSLATEARDILTKMCCWIAVIALSTAHLHGNQSTELTGEDRVQQQISLLIQQLGDPSFIKREAAKQDLEKLGLVAFESLRAAEMHDNVEISQSATFLLESMQVEWSLPTDSFEVQRLLKHYNGASVQNKLDALQRLSKLEKIDGYLALLRLMRYEKDDKISKVAGLYVIESAIDALTLAQNPAHDMDDKDEPLPWKTLIHSGASESKRATAKWLMTLADQLDAETIPVDVWHKHVSQERMLLESNTRSRTQSRLKTDDNIVKRLYRVVAKLLILKKQNAEALEFFEPCLDLVSKEQKEAFNDLQWMLEAGLPQGIVRLNELRPELFATRTRNRFILAEAHLKLNLTEQANQIAAEASNLTGLPAELARRITQAHPADSEALQRQSNFEYLVERGLFGWAEHELTRLLAKGPGELSIQQELSVRQRLANFYWTADEPALAADVWQPIMLRAGMLGASADPNNKELQTELMQPNSDDVPYVKYIPAHYYFYLGLAASKNGNWPEARLQLSKAAESDASDPDLLIAMYRATHDDTEYRKHVDALIESLESTIRLELEKAESDLVAARSSRTTYENAVAIQCNQLAWLLSCTNRKVADALMLGQRACNLTPDYAIYMDTFARCQFAAGNLDKAIELQTRAVKLMPYERAMQRQLEEFREAKKTQADK